MPVNISHPSQDPPVSSTFVAFGTYTGRVRQLRGTIRNLGSGRETTVYARRPLHHEGRRFWSVQFHGVPGGNYELGMWGIQDGGDQLLAGPVRFVVVEKKIVGISYPL